MLACRIARDLRHGPRDPQDIPLQRSLATDELEARAQTTNAPRMVAAAKHESGKCVHKVSVMCLEKQTYLSSGLAAANA